MIFEYAAKPKDVAFSVSEHRSCVLGWSAFPNGNSLVVLVMMTAQLFERFASLDKRLSMLYFAFFFQRLSKTNQGQQLLVRSSHSGIGLVR